MLSGHTPVTTLSVVLFAVMASCQPGEEPAVSPPQRTATMLDPAHRVSLDRTAQLRTPEGDNLAFHNAISDPCVMFENGRYRMWFTAANRPTSSASEMGIAYAESPDGINWTTRTQPDSRDPQLLVRPTPGEFDAGGVETAAVTRGPDGKYWMYYSGDAPPRGSNHWAIGAAVSDDGISWSKQGVVLKGRGGWEGPFTEGSGRRQQVVGGVSEPSVMYDSGRNLFRMWYSALGKKDDKIAFRVGYATSPDGIHWEAQPDPVLEPEAGSWDDSVVSHVDVSFDPGTGYHMFYFGTSGDNYAYGERKGAAMIPGFIGHAFSTDGLSWQRDANPVLNTVPGSSWEGWMVGGPSALIQEGQVKLWYFGSGKHNAYEFHMGLATGLIGGGGTRQPVPATRPQARAAPKAGSRRK